MKLNNFSTGQIKWASEHDWFVSGNQNEIVCLNQWADGKTAVVTHTSFQDLRDWAGY